MSSVKKDHYHYWILIFSEKSIYAKHIMQTSKVSWKDIIEIEDETKHRKGKEVCIINFKELECDCDE